MTGWHRQQQIRVRLSDWLHGAGAGLQLLAVLVGLGAGVGAVVFRWLVDTATRLLSGTADYTATPGAPHPLLPGLGRWFLVLAPVVAGLLYGPLIHRFAREARGHGVPEVMYAVAETGARIRPQVAAVKALASAICIGGGGSVGREGPIVQIGSALGSTVGQLARLPVARMRILVACGAAGGIAATFNAPLAGVFFALELILADFAVESFAAVVLAAVAASVVGRAILGDHPFLTLPAFTVSHPQQFLGFAALGVAAAGVGVLFSRILYAIEDVCDRLWNGPQWLRPAAGGLLLGALLLVVPQMYGVGYPVLGSAAAGAYTVTFLLVLLAAKIIATSLTIGIGGSGGVFAPSLFIGAMLGAATGQILHGLDPVLAPAPGAYALVGMGAVFAGAARTPITAVLIMFELTGQYRIILPLMLAIALAAGLSRLLSADTIYTRKLTRRGIDLLSPTRRLRQTSIVSAAGALPEPIPADASVAAVAARFAAGTADTLPVTDGAGQVIGVITAVDAEQALPAADATAAQIARPVPGLAAELDLESAMTQLARHHVGGLPVVTGDRITWITHHDLLRAAATIGRPAPRRSPAADVASTAEA